MIVIQATDDADVNERIATFCASYAFADTEDACNKFCKRVQRP